MGYKLDRLRREGMNGLAPGATATQVKLAIVASHPVQHFVHLYRSLDADPAIELRVFYGASQLNEPYFDTGFDQQITWAGDILSGYPYEVVSTGNPGDRIGAGRIRTALQEFSPDAVQVYGYSSGLSRTAMGWARRNHRCLLYVSDSDLTSRRNIRTRLKRRLAVPWLLRNVALALAVGDSNRDFYRKYAPSLAVRYCPFTFDSHAIDEAIERRLQHRTSLRRSLEVPANCRLLLYVGKLVDRKRPMDAVRALIVSCGELVAENRPYLVLAGEGPWRGEIERACQSEGAPIRLLGFVNTDRLPALYAACDALIHPSGEDPHPLAISEAVYAGLPVLVSDGVGSVGLSDDVYPGENALQHHVGDIAMLARNIVALMAEEPLRERLMEGSRVRALGRDVDSVAATYVRAILEVLC